MVAVVVVMVVGLVLILLCKVRCWRIQYIVCFRIIISPFQDI